MIVDLDDESDLTSLEDDGEQRAEGAAVHDLPLSYESSLTSEDESAPDDEDTPPQNGTQKSFSTTHVSPSRVGSSLPWPAPAAHLKTYRSSRTRTLEAFVKPRASKYSPEPPSDLEGYDSPLSPLPSPSPRKRRASTSTQQSLSSPSKRVKSRRSKEHNGVPKFTHEPRPASSRKMKPSGNASSLQTSPVSLSKGKRRNGEKHRTEMLAPSISAGPRKRSMFPSKSKSSIPNDWSLESLDPLVWVRVDRKNNVIDDDSIESFWWPAMTEPNSGRQKSQRVRLLAPPSGTKASRVVSIKRPMPSNIVPYKSHSHSVNSFWQLPSSSASSQPVGFEELKSRWEEGCKKIVEEDTRRNDGFPTSLTALLSQPLDPTEDAENDSASRASPERFVPPPASVEGEPWSPPLPDPNIAIPGEPILSTTRTKGYYGKFYPAKVIAYVAPSQQNVPPMYTVHFMDNFHEDVTRDMFYIYEQDEFGTCRLGKFESAESLYEKDGEDELDQHVSADASSQLVIPGPPKLPVPSPEEFCNLTMLEQTSYIIPILTRIVENNYKPAEQRVSAFLSGGRERVEVSKRVLQKGFLTRSDLNQLASIVKYWALSVDMPDGEMRDANSSHEIEVLNVPEQDSFSQPAERDAVEEPSSSPDDLLAKEGSRHSQDKEQFPSLPPSSLPPSSSIDDSPSSTPNVDGVGGDDRGIIVAETPNIPASQPFAGDLRTEDGIQSGGAAPQPVPSTRRSFKDLLSHEKIHFCTDVLLSEAVIQLLLWRAGKRRSVDPLSEKEELLLHESGANLASEFDIAHTVQDLRMKKEKLLQNRIQSTQEIQSTGGTRSRPRKV